ncbi:MAG: heme ABC exporter ATP-binding protein CcmA [Paracoccaceae bacterium]|nr:heme ABC exporter ATP-binding protein CcmA [Paracoccaceae bacterium]MDE2912640.1 heme ABC exporter ATP-binding protein CcmA [Paracoccaceae bacterium]
MTDLEAIGLACRRGEHEVFADLEFRVSAGCLLVVRGPNGSGKTTLLRCLAGLVRPSAGTIRTDPDETVYLGHRDAITAQMTVAENLRFWADIHREPTSSGGDVRHGDRDTDITKAAEALGLVPLLSILVGTLSEGQRRRVGLACLPVSRRNLWLLDEPATALDVESVAMFERLVRTHLESGGRVVATTQDPAAMTDFPSIKLTGPTLRSRRSDTVWNGVGIRTHFD